MEGIMMRHQLSEQIRKALFEAKRDNTLAGLITLEEHAVNSNHPEVLAWYGYCLAKERKAHKKGLDCCVQALKIDSRCSNAYLCMGKIYLQAGRLRSAMQAFSRGLSIAQDPVLQRELNKISTRKPPVFPFFQRQNALNIYSGRLLSKLKLR
jgi:tetratricopeptide (TPR) repeat protein